MLRCTVAAGKAGADDARNLDMDCDDDTDTGEGDTDTEEDCSPLCGDNHLQTIFFPDVGWSDSANGR